MQRELEEKLNRIMKELAEEDAKSWMREQAILDGMERGYSCIRCHEEVFVLRTPLFVSVTCGCPPSPFNIPIKFKCSTPTESNPSPSTTSAV